jgi:alpha-amylase
MGVLMQAFYWDCPKLEGKEFQWWDYVAGLVPSLSGNGFTALWLPPACKAANIGGMSMGYDPYDYYDLGDVDQKGSKETWFGSKDQLLTLIKTAHSQNLEVYADLVINHNNGGDSEEVNPIDGQKRWTKFVPGSGKFPRNWESFHPSYYESWDQMTFGDMPDLCHRNPDVYSQLIDYARWLIEEIGFDGFRYDFVKGYGAWMGRALQELRGLRNDVAYKPYGVGECWDSERNIDDWLDEVNTWSDNPLGAFDFPLRERLKNLCDTSGYSLNNLAAGGTLVKDRPMDAVTFVENHDIARSNPIINDKMMAYAFILTHEGYPCVFWQDYYNFGLAQEGNKSGIAALVKAHEDFAAGPTTVLSVDDDLYIMQRSGLDGKKGLVFALNNRVNWYGTRVATQWKNANFSPIAWGGRDNTVPQNQLSQNDGTAEFWAPPRGYVVYAPQ